MDVADKRRIEQRFSLDPKIVTGFALALGIGNQRRDQLQDVFLRMDVGKWVIVHTLSEIDGVQDFQAVMLSLKEFSALDHDAALGVSHDVGTVALHEVRFEPEPGLARAGRADDAGVEVAGVGRIFGPGVDGEQLRPGENDIVFKLGIDKGLDVLFVAP